MSRRLSRMLVGLLVAATSSAVAGVPLAAATTATPRGWSPQGVWSQAGASSRHDSYNPFETALDAAPTLTTLRQDWVATAPAYGDNGSVPPVVGGGRVYSATPDTTVQARDPGTGRLLWSARPAFGPDGEPAGTTMALVAYVPGHLITSQSWAYEGSCGLCTRVVALDPATGAVQWQVQGSLAGAVGADLTYAQRQDCDSSGCGDDVLEARSTSTGALVWSKVLAPGAYGEAFPAYLLDRGRLYVNAWAAAGREGPLRALDAATGRLLWRQPESTRPYAAAGGSGLLFTRGRVSQELWKVDPATGRVDGGLVSVDPVPGPFAVGSGRWYELNGDGGLFGMYLVPLSRTHGTFRPLGPTCPSVPSMGAVLLQHRLIESFSCEGVGKVYSVDLSTGRSQRILADLVDPVVTAVANGHLYVDQYPGTLRSYSLPGA